MEEQRMAISSGNLYYIPTCREEDPSQYAPCQCKSVYNLASPVCYCVDELGNVMDNKEMKELIWKERNTEDLEEVCASLQCDDLEPDSWAFANSAKLAMQIKDLSIIETESGAKEHAFGKGSDNLRIVLAGLIIFFCMMAMGISVYVACTKSSN